MEDKVITCIIDETVSGIIKQARELNLSKSDIVTMLTKDGQVYLIYYR